MQDEIMSLIKLNNKLFRYTQFYMDSTLDEYELSSGSYPFLLILNENEGISQNKISKEVNVDKAMSARTIKKLIETGYINKVEDEKDCRAYKLFLTEKAKSVIPEILDKKRRWIDYITRGLNDDEKKLMIKCLEKAMKNAKEYKMDGEAEEIYGEYK